MSGIEIRLNKIFNKDSGRSMIVAFDHGQSLPMKRGIGSPVKLMEKIIEGGPDGVLINRGLIRQCADAFAVPGAPEVVLRADWTTLDPEMKLDMGEAYRPLVEPEEVLELGASAACLYLIGRPKQQGMFFDNVREVAKFIGKAHKVGLPVVVEATLWGLKNEDQKAVDPLRQMCRIAAELGADAIKTEFVGNVADQKDLIAEVGDIPVLTLGGSATSPEKSFEAASQAIESGAKGLIFGRNVWQAEDIPATIRHFNSIVHQ